MILHTPEEKIQYFVKWCKKHNYFDKFLKEFKNKSNPISRYKTFDDYLKSNNTEDFIKSNLYCEIFNINLLWCETDFCYWVDVDQEWRENIENTIYLSNPLVVKEYIQLDLDNNCWED